MKQSRGLTVIELLVALSIFALLVAFGIPGLKAFFKNVEINNSLRTVTLALNSARYKAIENNKSVKLAIESNKFILLEKRNEAWEPFMDFDPGDKVTVSMNTSPVFYPEGYIVPLCTINVCCEEARYTITISIEGRIKVVKR
jgi:type IV fimbrial biogenesis protein FimT